MDISCEVCKSLLSITHVELGSLGVVEFQVEVCQDCLDKKQEEIDDLEVVLEAVEDWETQCHDLEERLKDAEQWEDRCVDLEKRIEELENQ